MPDSDLQQLDAPPRRRRKRLAWIVAAAVLVIALAAAGGTYYWQASNRPEPITIGFADTFAGADGFEVEEARAATQLYFNEVNAAGGIEGHMLELEAYNDRGQPAKAKADAANILAGRSVAVLGRSSDTSIGAEVDYREGHIASVTGIAGTDGQPGDSAYYFRALSPNSAQGAFLAEYIRSVLLRHTGAFFRAPDIDLVGSNGNYARSFLAGFQQGDNGAKRSIFMLPPGADLDASAKAVADQLADQPEPRIIVLGLPKDETTAVLKAIRRRAIRSMVILSSSAASDEFVQQFADEPEEKDEPGFFTDNLFAVAPVILDNTGLLGQGLVTGYWNGTGEHPGWFAAGAEDAARLVVEAIRRAHIGGTEASKQADRQKIRDIIAGFDSPANAVPGITDALYFDARHEMPRPMQYGYFHEGRFVSAPLQLVQVKDRDLVDIDGEIAQGHMVQIGEQFFWLQRVVSTGINIARINAIDTKDGTFNADFYLWIRYAGGDDLPSQIEFSDFEGNFDAAHPLRASVEDGIDYKLWRVNGTFKASFNLHDYPFDTQALVIRLQNREHPHDQIVYAIDTFGLEADARGLAGRNSDAFSDLQLWQVVTVAPFVTSFSIQSALGQPALFGTANRTEYGGFALAVLVKRNVVAFMVKALLPLFLLMLVVFSTLFFPPSMAKERLTIPVTGILTSAVLMISINNTLPPLGYTTALEYIFYTFFLLCLMALVVGLLAEILRNKTFHHHVIKVDLFGRIAYVTIVATTIAVYLWKYGAAMI
jgi:ABC-type branched-subunit amino acid transport system substrate-binding protein